MPTPQLPGYAASPITSTGHLSREWYSYLKWLGERDTSIEAAELPDYKLVGQLSVVVSGLLQNGLASLALKNDQLAPDALSYYGTDEDGEKGWHLLTADRIAYDNTGGALDAENVQDALDELSDEKLDDAPSNGSEYVRKDGAWAVSSGGGGGGAMSYIGTATVAGSAATTLTLSGLDMASEQSYFVQFSIKSAQAANGIGIRVNGDSTAANYGRAYTLAGAGGGAVGGNNASNYDIGSHANGEKLTGVAWITKDTDGHVRAHLVCARGGKSNLIVEVVDIVWESAANLTSFGFVASVASGLAIGSTFKVFKVVG